MASGQVAAAVTTMAARAASIMPAQDELRQMEEFDKIVRFRDVVISGAHPRVKLPAHLTATKAVAPAASSFSPNLDTSSSSSRVVNPQLPDIRKTLLDGAQKMSNAAAFQDNGKRPAVAVNLPGLAALPTAPAASDAVGLPKPFGSRSGRAEIDPIFLTKSDDLIKAEIQLQRTRIERALREQLEQRRSMTKISQASDSLADFSVADVLQQALVLVQSTAAPTADPDVAANKPNTSGSHHHKTFSSSSIGSPEPSQAIRLPDKSEETREDDEDMDTRGSSDYEPELDVLPAAAALADPVATTARDPSQPQLHLVEEQSQRSVPNLRTQQPSHIHILPHAAAGASRPVVQNRLDVDLEIVESGQVLQVISSQESGEASGSGETDNEQSHSGRQLRTAHQASPLVRGHDLSPIAPQPAHVSPLATSRQLPAAAQGAGLLGTPAQVAALRKGPSAVSSPESSSQGANVAEKRKGKKKNKRKADREADASPFIKLEPRSPSPLSAPSFVRPTKRQKQGQRNVTELSYDEIRYEQPANNGYPDSGRYTTRFYQTERTPVVYERRDSFHARQDSRPVIVHESTRNRELYDERQAPSNPQYIRRPESPIAYPAQYSPREGRPVRSASHAVLESAAGYPGSTSAIPRAPHDAQRMSVRPTFDRDRSRSPIMYTRTPAIPTARIPPTTRVVDEFGREYFEPPRPASTAVRHPPGPPSRLDETEFVYERVPHPMAAASRHSDTFEENGVIYRRASPSFVAPRRVVTQPEYAEPAYRGYRQREYSVRPPPSLGDEQLQTRPPPERRVLEQPPREYVARATSVRPPEPIRYELARGYGERIGSVRPEVPVRQYATSTAYPKLRRQREDGQLVSSTEIRREVIEQPVMREYSVRPGAQALQRAYSVRPVEQPYYGEPVRRDDEVAYIEQSRATEELEMPYSAVYHRDEF